MQSSSKSETFIDGTCIGLVALMSFLYEKALGENARVRRICRIVLLPLLGLACFSLFFVVWGVFVAESAYVDYGTVAWLTAIIVSVIFAFAGVIAFAAWFNLMCSDEERRASQKMMQ